MLKRTYTWFPPALTLREAFEMRVIRGEKPQDCWRWAGSLNPCGYGRTQFQGVHHLAHRLSYELDELAG